MIAVVVVFDPRRPWPRRGPALMAPHYEAHHHACAHKQVDDDRCVYTLYGREINTKPNVSAPV